MSSDLKTKLIRIGSANPELRDHLRPVLAELEKSASYLDYIVPSLVGLAKDLDSMAVVDVDGDYGNVVLQLNADKTHVSYRLKWLGQNDSYYIGSVGYGPRVWAASMSRDFSRINERSADDLKNVFKSHKVKFFA